MRKAGYTDLAVSLSIRRLLIKGLINLEEGLDYEGDPWSGYSVTDVGEAWLFNNIEKLTLKQPPPPDDDLPF